MQCVFVYYEDVLELSDQSSSIKYIAGREFAYVY